MLLEMDLHVHVTFLTGIHGTQGQIMRQITKGADFAVIITGILLLEPILIIIMIIRYIL